VTVTFIQSPYAGDVDRNVRYAKLACLDSIARGETPFASHLLYTQFLNDRDPEQRAKGLQFERKLFSSMSDAQVAVYTDLGISRGMQSFIEWINGTFFGTVNISYRRMFDDECRF
jgi:hypothetical protein